MISLSVVPALNTTGKEDQIPSKRRLRLRTKLLLVACAMAIAFVLIEMMARVLYRQTTVLFPRYHTSATYGDFKIRRIRPNSDFWHTSVDGHWEFRINSAGFRNERGFVRPKPPGKFRVLCLGDSHTQGYEVNQDKTYSSVIEQELRKSGLDAEVINAGVSGFGTAEELVFLENEGITYGPDVVVLGFFANDYEDNLKAGLFKLNPEGKMEVARHEHVPGVNIQDRLYAIPGTMWLGEHSYAYALAFNAVWDFYKARLTAKSRAQVVEESAVSGKEAASEVEAKLAGALLRRMAEFCRLHAIKFVILDLPKLDSRDQVASSLEPAQLAQAKSMADWVLTTQHLCDQEPARTAWHVPHGQRHISEPAHALIGASVAKKIIEWKTAEGNVPHPVPTTTK